MVEQNKAVDLSNVDRRILVLLKMGYSIDTENCIGIKISKDGVCIEGDAQGNTLTTFFAVFIQNEYSFSLRSNNYTVIDIGMNIGATSLWFAQNPAVKKIYSFEPAESTYKQAVRNLEYNPALAQKIEAHCYGIGGKEGTVTVSYNPAKPGQTSSVVDRFAENADLPKEILQIKEASSVLEPIINENDNKIFLKIDCEGAEFEIMENLHAKRLLKKIDVIIMEWHYRPPERIIEILEQNKFMVFCTHEIRNYVGMLRAVRIA